ncbi:MAG: hypothetical protein AABX51_05320 [Nanoarchaeota archaeon]
MKKSQAEIEQEAKKIIDEFAKALEAVKEEVNIDTELFDSMRTPDRDPEKGLKINMLRNFPKTKDGEPQMEKKGW